MSKSKIFVPHIPPHANLVINHDLKFKQRGIKSWNAVWCATLFPFSFFQLSKKISTTHSLYVLPKPLKVTLLSSSVETGNVEEEILGNVTRSASEYFVSLREYKPGDSIKAISWKASAKYEKLISKEHQEILPEGISIMLFTPDNFSIETQNTFEQMITLTASLIWEAAKKKTLLFFVYEDESFYGADEANNAKIMRTLATAQIQKKEKKDSLGIEKIPPRSSAIIISDKVSEEMLGACKKLLSNNCHVTSIILAHNSNDALPANISCFRWQAFEENPSRIVLEPIAQEILTY